MDTGKKELLTLKQVTQGRAIYVAGGPVRDILLDRKFMDLDLVLFDSVDLISQQFAALIRGKVIVLDEEHMVYRVIGSGGRYYDFSAPRDPNHSIEGDLFKRDFTINAMALPLDAYILRDLTALIDPLDGRLHLKKGIIRMCNPGSFSDDPLRILRAYRFCAELGFTIEEETEKKLIECQAEGGLRKVAGERLDYEFTRILEVAESWRTMVAMGESGTLMALIPPFQTALGVDQPGFHHLDVFWHLIETLKMLEQVIMSPGDFFTHPQPINAYLTGSTRRTCALKWAALLHDIGKPYVRGQKGERVTFYNHDKKGSDTVLAISKRFKWPKWREQLVMKLVANHMRPFHLLNDLRKGGPTKKAMRRLIKDLGEDYVGLFILSMADTLAGAGPLKPKNLENEVSQLFEKVHNFYLETLKPMEKKGRLLNGKEVMSILGIAPGPVVGLALEAIEEAQCEGEVRNKEEAASFLRKWHTNFCRSTNT